MQQNARIVSAEFIERLRRHPDRAYQLWRRHGVAPTTGSKLIHGAALVHENDPRIVALGRELGLSAAECFEQNEVEGASAPQPSAASHGTAV